MGFVADGDCGESVCVGLSCKCMDFPVVENQLSELEELSGSTLVLDLQPILKCY